MKTIGIQINTEVSGQQDLVKLASSLDDLAETLDGDLRVQAQASAAALRELAQSQDAIEGFKKLKAESVSVAEGLEAAQLAAQKMGAELAASGAPTESQTRQMNKLRDAVGSAKAEVEKNGVALQGARKRLSEYGISANELAKAQVSVSQATKQVTAEFAKSLEASKQAATQQTSISASVSAANDRAVEQARRAAAARVDGAARSLAAERTRADFIQQYQTREAYQLDTLIARSREVAAQYPRLAQAAQASAAQQVLASGKVEGGLGRIGDQLRAVQRVAIAAIGGTFAGQVIGTINETAESFARAGDRIKIVTGEGEAFGTAFEGVQQVALNTNTALESTATLFSRIDKAGQALGKSQQEALQLTETINQAIQISGGAASSGEAAIVQLVQGLQSGVLRGEEFNSVLEQAPRLAEALAAGLGKNTGELRKLAAQGALTSEVVLNALQGQGAAIDEQFQKLSGRPTRAIQNLSTAWTIYLGNADKATGASEAVANAIEALAENLDTVANLLVDVGQAAAAFAALRLAQTFLGIGAAATASATAIGANTVAMTAANAASAGLVGNVGKLGGLLKGLRSFSLVGLLVNAPDIGKWIGEGIAKLQGYKDASKELAEQERASAVVSGEQARQKAAYAQALQLAAEAARGLTPEARLLVAEFDKLRTAGKSASDVLAEVGKSANLQDTAGIQAYMLALRDLQVQGKASGDQIRQSLADALKGEDLAKFEVLARNALMGTRDEVEGLATVLDASLREAIRRSGADFASISGGMSVAAVSAINDTDLIIQNLDRLSDQGVDTAAALTASLGKGIKTADSQAALKAVRGQIEAVRKSLGNTVANGLLSQLEDQARKAAEALGGLGGALKKLGVTSDVELKKAAADTRALYDEVVRTGGSAREQAQAFEKMAEAAIASGDRAALAFVKSQAAVRGVEVAVDGAGKTIVRSMEDAKRATDNVGRSARGASKDYGDMGRSAEGAAASAKKLAEINQRYGRPGGSSTQQGNEPNYDPGRNPYGRAGQNDQPRNGNGQTQAEFQRSEKLAGQGASDETLRFALLEKLNKGTLSEGDLGDLKNVVATLRENQRMFDSLGIGTADNSTLRDDQKWQAIQARFQQAIDKFQGQSGALPTGVAGVGRTVRFELALNNKEYGAASMDEQSGNNLESFLSALERGRGTVQ